MTNEEVIAVLIEAERSGWQRGFPAKARAEEVRRRAPIGSTIKWTLRTNDWPYIKVRVGTVEGYTYWSESYGDGGMLMKCSDSRDGHEWCCPVLTDAWEEVKS